jgi:hypothetical protein
MDKKEPPMGKTGIFKKLIKPEDADKPTAGSGQQEVISGKLEEAIDKSQDGSRISPIMEIKENSEAATKSSPAAKEDLPADSSKLQTVSKNQPAAIDKPPATRRKRSGIDNKSLKQAIDEARDQPKITITCFEIAAIMRYVQITTSRFYPSTECKEMLEKEVREKYPELFAAVEKMTKR